MNRLDKYLPWTLALPAINVLIFALTLIVGYFFLAEDDIFENGLGACLVLFIVEIICCLLLLIFRKFTWFFIHLGIIIAMAVAFYFCYVLFIATALSYID